MRFPPPPPYPPPPLSECDRPPPSGITPKRRPSDASSVYSITSNGSSINGSGHHNSSFSGSTALNNSFGGTSGSGINGGNSASSARCGAQPSGPNPRGPPVNMATSLQKAGLIRPVAYKPVASGSPLSPYGVSPNGRPPSCQSAPPADYLVSLDGRRNGEATAQDSYVVYTDTEEYEAKS